MLFNLNATKALESSATSFPTHLGSPSVRITDGTRTLPPYHVRKSAQPWLPPVDTKLVGAASR